MRYFIISLCVLLVSCNTSKEKKEVQFVNPTTENELVQNIYVVKTIIYAKSQITKVNSARAIKTNHLL